MRESLLHAYIDETGDRGTSASASEWFALVAVLIPHEHEWMARCFISGFRSEVVRTHKALHWSEHFRPKHGLRRAQMVELMTLLPASVVVVATHKPCLQAGADSLSDGSAFYNDAYRLLLERIARAARGWPGGPRLAQVRADSVKGMNHRQTVTHVESARDEVPRVATMSVPWDRVAWPPTWHDSSAYDGLQLADMYSASLGAALRRDTDEWVTPWLHQIRQSGTPDVWRRGFTVTTNCAPQCLVPAHPWAEALVRTPGRTG